MGAADDPEERVAARQGSTSGRRDQKVQCLGFYRAAARVLVPVWPLHGGCEVGYANWNDSGLTSQRALPTDASNILQSHSYRETRPARNLLVPDFQDSRTWPSQRGRGGRALPWFCVVLQPQNES